MRECPPRLTKSNRAASSLVAENFNAASALWLPEFAAETPICSQCNASLLVAFRNLAAASPGAGAGCSRANGTKSSVKPPGAQDTWARTSYKNSAGVLVVEANSGPSSVPHDLTGRGLWAGVVRCFGLDSTSGTGGKTGMGGAAGMAGGNSGGTASGGSSAGASSTSASNTELPPPAALAALHKRRKVARLITK